MRRQPSARRHEPSVPAATELIKNAFGAQPRGMGSYALVPMSWVGDRDTRPLSELAESWRAR